jgi:hypothetical protein
MFDRQVGIDWIKHLDRVLRRACPRLVNLFADFPLHYYWSAEQTEWATDLVFRSRAALGGLYPRWIDFGMRTFGSRDVMRFLGRNFSRQPYINGHFKGEVVSDVAGRPEGVRIKHRVNRNAVKMYDKQGSVLRVETTINDARDLKTFRRKEGQRGGKKSWRPLRKGVADLARRAQLSQATNERYLEALAAAGAPTPLKNLAQKVCQPAVCLDRRVRALNPLSADDARWLAAVHRGEFTLKGFRNRDLRRQIFGADPEDAAVCRKRSAQVSRRLRLLKAHRLIRKIPGTHRYRVTRFGAQAIAAFLAANNASIEKLTQAAA